MYYLIREKSNILDVFTINHKYREHFIEYQTEFDINVKSGKVWGKYLVAESYKHEFFVYDITDILMPIYLKKLPTENYSSLTEGNNDFYIWGDETKIVIPMKSREDNYAYLFYYDLSLPKHNWLLQKFEIGLALDTIYSIRLANFNYQKLIYVYMDSYIFIYRIVESF